MSKENKMNMGTKFLLIAISIPFLLFIYFYAIEPEIDNRNIAKMVCEDLNKTYSERHSHSYDASNYSRERHYTTDYKVDCSGDIIKYKPHRNVYWKFEDCDIKNKWGECKVIIPKRIKSLHYS